MQIHPRPAGDGYLLPSDSTEFTGKWIEVNLTQTVIGAVEGQTVRKLYRTSPGRPGWETTRGKHHVCYQLPSDIMAGPGYLVAGVRWVSYFLPGGEAVHAGPGHRGDQLRSSVIAWLSWRVARCGGSPLQLCIAVHTRRCARSSGVFLGDSAMGMR